MDIWLQAILALLLLAAAVYAQKQIPVYTKGGARVAVTRTILLLIGIGFGLTGTAYISERLPQLLAFLIGFGLVHQPAAVNLFIKDTRGSGTS